MEWGPLKLWLLLFCQLVDESCRTVCDPMDASPLGFSVHGISLARILEWVAISSSRGSFRTESPASAAGFFPTEPPGKAQHLEIPSPERAADGAPAGSVRLTAVQSRTRRGSYRDSISEPGAEMTSGAWTLTLCPLPCERLAL